MPSVVPAHELSSREQAAPRGRRSLTIARGIARNARGWLRPRPSLAARPLADLDPIYRPYVAAEDLAGGCALELAVGATLPERKFRLIVSQHVLDRIRDLDRAFAAIDRLLAPGGRMLHKIDLGDRGIFTGAGLHPLEFLTLSEPVYGLASGGRSNRRRIDYYRRKMRELGYFAGLFVTNIAGLDGKVEPPKASIVAGEDYFAPTAALLRSIRPRLARPFRDLADEDLAVTGMLLVAQKP